ncbi:hypothetical protein AAOGI_32370 [Agarivorans albus]
MFGNGLKCEELERKRMHTLNQLNALKAEFPNIGYIKTLLIKAHWSIKFIAL